MKADLVVQPQRGRVEKTNINFMTMNIQVGLLKARRDSRVSFRNCCPKHKEGKYLTTPVKMKRHCPECDKEIDYSSMVSCYPITKGKLMPIDKDKLKAEGTDIQIREFEKRQKFDWLGIKEIYYLVPIKSQKQSYADLYHILEGQKPSTPKVAIGKYTKRGKERLINIIAWKGCLVLVEQYFKGEITDKPAFEMPESNTKILQLGQKLTKMTQEQVELKNNYAEKLEKLLNGKPMPITVKAKNNPSGDGLEKMLEAM